jgi:copper chaperone CopZ
MRSSWLAGLALLTAVALPLSVSAGEVTVKGVHICCGGCVTALTGALDGINGVSGASASKNGGTVKFQATDAKAAAAGLKAIADAGFYGTATHDGKTFEVPAPKIDAKLTADTVTLTGVHLCCGMCVKESSKALKKVNGVSEVEGDKDNGTLTVKGTKINVSELVQALHGAGFHGDVKK